MIDRKWWLINSDDAIHCLLHFNVITRAEATRFLRRQGYGQEEAVEMIVGWQEESP